MQITNVKTIDLEEFLAICRSEAEVPATEEQIRSIAGATYGIAFRQYTVPWEELFEQRLYTASDTDKNRTRWFTSKDKIPFEERRMLTFKELMKHQDLLDEYVVRLKKDRGGRTDIKIPHAMTLHCAACDGYWLFDGNHGFIRAVLAANPMEFLVTEMTAPKFKMRACRCDSA